MLVKVPQPIRMLYRERIWKMPSEGKKLYLSFDDGPIPGVTPWVLDQLARYGAKATFFCIGDNVNKHPELFRRLLSEGHTVGNHTHNHLNGWKTSTEAYLENVLLAERYFSEAISGSGEKQAQRFFRPPYGKLKSRQARLLKKEGFNVVMWDILSRDYDRKISPQNCYRAVIQKAEPGSIIVFHDSLKAERNLRVALPRVLDHFSRNGFVFEGL